MGYEVQGAAGKRSETVLADQARLRNAAICVAVAWTLVLGGSLAWTLVNEYRQIDELAWEDAVAHFNKDHAFRLWATSHGGVYVPADERTPPNPYLEKVRDRDVTTTSGKQLTLMNPAYMLRQVMADYEKLYGVKGRITSLNVLNPVNAPDAWEREALEAFETGRPEASETVMLDGQEYFRLMRPMLTTAKCLKCHAHQGYLEGQVRGGVGVAVPMAPYVAQARPIMVSLAISHGVIWAIGLGGIGLAWRHRRRRVVQRALAQDALRQSEESLSITLDSIGDGVIATDIEGRVVRMNPVAERLTGWTGEQAARESISDVFHIVSAETGERAEDPVQKVLKHGEVVGLANHTVLISRDGTERQVADSGAPIRDRAGRIAGVVLVFRDVTEEYALQEQLHQAQKMEAIGQLAGGVAHDFNNLLTAILGNAQLIRDRMEAGAPEGRFVKEIEVASRRAASLTQQLLDFSHKGRRQMICVDLHTIIAEVIDLLTHSIDKRITIMHEMSAQSSSVMGDPAQIQSALLNLALNARDAMPEGGELTLATRNVVLDHTYCQLSSDDLTPGRYVEVAVTDTGVGMSPETQERIFEPFFSTKTRGRGTGLGLAVVYGFTTAHHGLLRVHSEEGKGTTFRLLLPLGDEDQDVQVRRPRHRVSGRGHVLIVDDEEFVRNVAAKTLQDAGYTVSTCFDGVEALAEFRKNYRDIDLVLLDMAMPRMDGQAVFAKMKTIQPDVRVVMFSGFSRSGAIADILDQGVRGFVSNPFDLDELSHQVARHIRPSDPAAPTRSLDDGPESRSRP